MGCTASSRPATSPVISIREPIEAEFHNKYSIGQKVGKGSFAQVHFARNKLFKKGGVAVKVRSLQSQQSQKENRKTCISACKEVCLWSHVGKHQNCVLLHESFFEDNLCYMVMEKCDCELITYLGGLDLIAEKTLSPLFAQMLQGISHVHSVNIVHRDIKPDNFLIGGKDRKTVKLADFGLAAYVPAGKKASGFCGTPPFMSPEMLIDDEYEFGTDVWSFGVLVHVLLAGAFPYASHDGTTKAMKQAIIEGENPRCIRKWLSSEACSFMQGLLQRNAKKRFSVAEAMNTPFIAGGDKGNQYSLKSVIMIAVRSGIFDSPGIREASDVDVLLHGLKSGKVKCSGNMVLAQDQIEELLEAAPGRIGEFLDKNLLVGCNDEVSSTQSVSTRCDSSPSRSISKGTAVSKSATSTSN